MATKEQVEELRKICQSGLGLSIEKLVSRPETWGEINFERARPSLETAHFLFNAYATLPVEILPQNEIQQLTSHLRAVASNMEGINKFRLATDNPRAQSDQMTAALNEAVDAAVRGSFAPLPFLAYHRGDVDAQLAKLEEYRDLAKKAFEETQALIAEKTKHVDDAVTAARNTAAKAGAAVFTQDFFEEAKRQEDGAFWWLLTCGGFAAGAVAAAIVSFIWFQPPENASVAYVLQFTVTKLVVIGGLITAAVWCGNIYRALRHQIAINRHRGNGLKTFQAFIEAAGDRQEVRDAVLLETTRSIFAVVPSGFLNATETNADGGLRAADAAKILSKGAG
jgi:hypothetical protein